MTITTTKSELTEILKDLKDLTDISDIRYDYSGRGMNGKTCLGIVIESHQAVPVSSCLIGLSAETRHLKFDLCFDDPYIANIGCNKIIYWPDIQVEDKGPI